MSHEPPEYLASLDRISIPALRRAAGLADANRSYRIDPQGNVDGTALLALVEAVEAAQAVAKGKSDGEGWHRLSDALARFEGFEERP